MGQPVGTVSGSSPRHDPDPAPRALSGSPGGSPTNHLARPRRPTRPRRPPHLRGRHRRVRIDGDPSPLPRGGSDARPLAGRSLRSLGGHTRHARARRPHRVGNGGRGGRVHGRLRTAPTPEARTGDAHHVGYGDGLARRRTRLHGRAARPRGTRPRADSDRGPGRSPARHLGKPPWRSPLPDQHTPGRPGSFHPPHGEVPNRSLHLPV